eukprot:Phypoly_transcript_00653.p1 GENE.Phypoly_transcript_00653~~Phypoly_transcript_00653.p1  ORF type:complete len:492 (+),score=108.03 Phypoly_transcript_00653:2140-3615(+)
MGDNLIDSHCHAHDNPKSLHLLKKVKAQKLFLMGTSPSDWITLQNLTPTEKIHIGFGIHPWHASGIIESEPKNEENNYNKNENKPENKNENTNENKTENKNENKNDNKNVNNNKRENKKENINKNKNQNKNTTKNKNNNENKNENDNKIKTDNDDTTEDKNNKNSTNETENQNENETKNNEDRNQDANKSENKNENTSNNTTPTTENQTNTKEDKNTITGEITTEKNDENKYDKNNAKKEDNGENTKEENVEENNGDKNKNKNKNNTKKEKKNTLIALPEYSPIDHNENKTLILLKKYLVNNPKSFVGEVGVDRVIIRRGGNPCPLHEQWALFDAQINLACELNRPVSVHCVDVFGAMFEYFQARTELPPAIALHSFGGSADIVKRYTNLPKYGGRFYFGFSYAINSRSKRLTETISKVPLTRILLESDLPDPVFIDDNLKKMCSMVATAHEISNADVASQTTKKALPFPVLPHFHLYPLCPLLHELYRNP